jgi:hypothetical protein
MKFDYALVYIKLVSKYLEMALPENLKVATN